MTTDKFSGEVQSAYGKPISAYLKGQTKLGFEGEYEKFDSPDECRRSGEWPNDAQVLEFVNAQRKATARASATQDALTKAGIEKPKADDPRVIFANMVKQLVLAGKDEQTARSLAENLLGYGADGPAA